MTSKHMPNKNTNRSAEMSKADQITRQELSQRYAKWSQHFNRENPRNSQLSGGAATKSHHREEFPLGHSAPAVISQRNRGAKGQSVAWLG